MESDVSQKSWLGAETEFQILFDHSCVCVQAGPAGASPLGFDPASLAGLDIKSFGLPAALADRLQAQVSAVLATGLLTTRHITLVSDGQLRDYALAFSPVFGLDAAIAYIACVGRDITDVPMTPLIVSDTVNPPSPLTPPAQRDPRMSVSDPLEDAPSMQSPGQSDSQSRFMDTVADALDVGIMTLDAQGVARAINPEAARLLDVSKDAFDKTQPFVPGSPYYGEDGTPLSLSDLPWSRAERSRAGAATLIGRKLSALAFLWISVTLKTLSDPLRPGKSLTLVTLKDVTQQRRTESQYLRQIADAERRSVVVDARNSHLSQANQQLAQQNEALGTLATQDGLTTLKNHQAFQERLREETRRALRTKEPLSLLILDVDYFKRFNDDYGHPAGDRMLRNLAETMLQTARTTDLVARYGGEEFAIILPETDAEGAYIIAERIRLAVETRRWDDRAVTVSIGVSTLHFDQIEGPSEWSLATLPKQMIEEADRAMYKSKRGGRNRVTAYVPDPQPTPWLLSADDATDAPSDTSVSENL